jgi:hypothetical protein
MEGFGFGLTSVAVTAAPGLDERYRGRLLTWTRA